MKTQRPGLAEISAMARYFRELDDTDRYSGVVRITQGDRELFAGAYGYASRSWSVRNSLAMRFDTASITKLFTAVAVLQLIDCNRLALDTPAVAFLGLEDTTIAANATVYHLLTHSSGIGDDADEEAGESYEALWETRPNYAVVETKDFLPQFAHKPANFAPGQGCRYCNCGYILLGLMVEKASGLSYRDYVRQKIFGPAAMHDSDFLRQDQVYTNVAEGNDPLYDAAGNLTGWKTNIYSFPPIGSPDGGAYVTAADLDRFLRAVRSGQLLSPAMTTAFFTPQVYHSARGEGSQHYGYGLWFYLDAKQRVVFAEKEGINVGVSGLIRHYPGPTRAEDINVVLLSNTQEGVWQPIRQLETLINMA